MKNKLKLKELSLNSFSTSLEKKQTETINGQSDVICYYSVLQSIKVISDVVPTYQLKCYEFLKPIIKPILGQKN